MIWNQKKCNTIKPFFLLKWRIFINAENHHLCNDKMVKHMKIQILMPTPPICVRTWFSSSRSRRNRLILWPYPVSWFLIIHSESVNFTLNSIFVFDTLRYRCLFLDVMRGGGPIYKYERALINFSPNITTAKTTMGIFNALCATGFKHH